MIGSTCSLRAEGKLLRVGIPETGEDYGWRTGRHATSIAAEERSRRNAEARRAAEERARAAGRRIADLQAQLRSLGPKGLGEV